MVQLKQGADGETGTVSPNCNTLDLFKFYTEAGGGAVILFSSEELTQIYQTIRCHNPKATLTY
jgi:hypothetical protein